ncbi:MviM Predicted dehydrogenases and related proteins [Candidatus Nanopelagicaceae bacterium]|jgi:scyllo-inositol 2-dehydrogenase (NADP+)
MRVVVVGLGIQGKKRISVAKNDVVATVDSANSEADYQDLSQVPLELYDAAILCVPDSPKFDLVEYLIQNHKHVLVEKPLWVYSSKNISRLEDLAVKNSVRIQVAYNHRFEPNIIRLREIIKKNELGDLYSVSIYYGNGTARLVRDSPWRDEGQGVLLDLGSHLLDMLDFVLDLPHSITFAAFLNKFENKSPDRALLVSNKSKPVVSLEMNLCMWRNTFRFEIIGSMGSAHIDGLCKWGSSVLTLRERVLPSGVPKETTLIEPQGDPTWVAEYDDFNSAVRNKIPTSLQKDLWILNTLNSVSGD